MSNTKDGFKIGGGLIAGIIGLALLGLLATFVFGGASWLTAPFRGEVEKRNLTEGSGSYRIAAYEKFYDQCAAIQALEDQIANMEADKSLPKDQRATNILALTNQRNTLIRQYNADAAKTETRGNFQASDLPYTLSTETETTTCAA